MEKIIHLLSGEKLYFEQLGAVGLVRQGSVDLYAVTKNRHERMFLLQRDEGQYFFGLFDEFQSLELFLVAKTSVEIVLYSSEMMADNGLEPQILRPALQNWFKSLLIHPWLRFFAVRNDEYVGQWNKGAFLNDIADNELWLTFLEHENILALLLSGQLNSLKKYFKERLNRRKEKKQKLIGAAIDILTGADDTEPYIDSHHKLEGLSALVHRIAKALHMEEGNLNLPIEVIRQLSKEALVKRLMYKAGLRMRPVLLENGWWQKDCGVLLVVREGEFYAAIPTSPGQYQLYDSVGEHEPITDDIAAGLEKKGLVCYAGFPQRKLKIKDLLTFMVNQCWRSDYKYILLASIVAGFIPLLTPIITKSIFSDIIPIHDKQSLVTLTQVLMVAGFTSATVALVRAVAVLRITSHLDMATEAALWSRLLSLPADFFKRYQTGELLQRMSGIDAIKSFVTGEFVSSIFNTVFSFWSVLLMCYYSLKLTGIALLVWIVFFIVTAVIYRRVLKYQKNLVDASNKTSGQVVQIFNGLAKFRGQGAEEQAFYLWAKCFGEEWKWNLKLRWQNNYSTIINSVQPLILCMILYYTAVDMMEQSAATGQQSMTYAEFLGFEAAFSAFNTTLVSMIPLAAKIFGVKPHIENLRPILEAEPEHSEEKIEAGYLTGEIEIRHLSFAYGKGLPDVLCDINLLINAGESVAIVGRSGCGKSTLVRLLLGFEKAKAGAIYYDNMDLNDLSLASVRSQMGVVLQDGKLLAGSIFDNIVGTTAMTMDDAWIAAKRVGLDKDIKEMPMGMHTAISEGSGNISGGQRQRILLARSIVNNPHILILDEATSALDNTTQAIVTRSLEEMSCTRVIIAHRLSTIRNVDRIIVMDAGRIAEEGSFEELMAQNGIFAELARRQLA